MPPPKRYVGGRFCLKVGEVLLTARGSVWIRRQVYDKVTISSTICRKIIFQSMDAVVMECDRSDNSKDLRQGDVFAAHPNSTNWEDPWRRFGVVLSADCDIVQGKTGPNLVYVPVVGLHTYLADVWLPTQALKLYDQGTNRLEKALHKVHSKNITVRHALTWTDQQFEQALTSPQIGSEAERDKHIKNIFAIRSAISELSKLRVGLVPSGVGELRSLLDRFFASQELIASVDKPGSNHRRKMINDALCALAAKDRADTWPICDLVGLDPEMREEENCGFVIDLRRFAIVRLDLLLCDRSIWLEKPESYMRICRLRGVYKSDLMQKFANLFIRVGLEDRRDEEHRLIFNGVAKRLFPEL